jgi:hypothetical protein
MKQKNALKIAMVVLAICFVQNRIFAQENPAIPSKKAFIAELNFNPFGENIISFNQLQLKYRVGNHTALRLGLAFDRTTNHLSDEDYLPSEPRKITGDENLTKFGILPGIEYHFLKNSKVSPYLGLELSFFNRSVKSHYRDYSQEYDNNLGEYRYIPIEVDIEGSTRSITTEYIQSLYGYSYYSRTEYLNRAYTSFGGNLLAGCDFYFMRNMYAGVEIGLGYNFIKQEKVTIDFSNEVDPTIIPSFTTSKFGLYYNSALRLGFWF